MSDDEHKDGSVVSPESTEAEREWRLRLGDLGGGVGGRSRSSGSSRCSSPADSSGANESDGADAQCASVRGSPCSEPSAGSEALAQAEGSFVSGASRGGISSSSAFSPSKNIRESLITLRVGRRECRSRRRATGDVEKLLGLVGEGGADGPFTSSQGSSGRWAPGRPLRTCARRDSRPSAKVGTHD